LADQVSCEQKKSDPKTHYQYLMKAYVTLLFCLSCCSRVTPEPYTLAFMKSIDLDHRDFIYDIEHKAYTMESITESWFGRLQDLRNQWDRKGMIGKLQYKGLSPNYTYLRNESYAVETFTKTVIFQAGDIKIEFKPSDLTRMDGRWKAFKLPSTM